MLTLRADEPLAVALTDAVQCGNLAELKRLAESPTLATAALVRRDRCGEQARSLPRGLVI